MIGNFEEEPTPNHEARISSGFARHTFRLVSETGSAEVFDMLNNAQEPVSLREVILEASTGRPLQGTLVSALVSQYERAQLLTRNPIEGASVGHYNYELTPLGRKIHSILATASEQIVLAFEDEFLRKAETDSGEAPNP